MWANGTPTVLPTLGTISTPATALPLATAINNKGQVTGTAVTGTGALDGFLWSNGKITDLGPTFSPAAINNNGVIVGGPLIDSGGALQNLNNLIPAGPATRSSPPPASTTTARSSPTPTTPPLTSSTPCC